MRCPDIKITIRTWFCSLLIIRDWSYSGMYINIYIIINFIIWFCEKRICLISISLWLSFYKKGFNAYKRIVRGNCLARCLVAIIIRFGLIPLVWVWLILQLYALMRFWDNTTIVIWYFQHVSYNNSIKSVRIAAMLAIIVSLFYPNNLHERL